jgi:hypothetical protein
MHFQQGDLTVSEYCRKFKNMADALADLGSPVDDRILVLNILRGLNPRFEHLGAIIRRYTTFSSFLKVQDDLILEELHLDSSGPPADAMTLYTCPAPAAARPPAPTPAPTSRPLSNGGTGKKGKNKKNTGDDRGRGGNSDNTTLTPLAPSGTDAKVPASWPTYVNPWQGHIAMYPGPLPGGFQRPQALMVAPGYYPAPGYTPGQQQQTPYQPLAPANWSPWTGSGWDQQSLENYFNTLALTPSPTTQDWVADSGTSHHSTPSAGNISHPRTLTSSSPSSIIVGNDSTLPITSVGDSVLPGPFYLNNILSAPDLV